MPKKILVFIFLIAIIGNSPAFAGFITKKTYTITDYGALGDGRTLNTKIIQSVIDTCASKGGGTLVIPKGVFLTGALFLKQDVDLVVNKDGVLKGSTQQADYPQINTRWEGVERLWTSALINAINLKGPSISGEGTIDGSGADWPKLYRQSKLTWDQLPQASRDSILKIPRLGRPRLICFQNCSGVRISTIKLRNQAVWCLHILYCNNVLVENVNIRANHTILSSDGIDVDSSTGVTISACDIDVNDDCISIKSGKDEDGLRVNKPSENIRVKNCRFGYGHGGVAMGSETSGGIRDVLIEDCIADSGNWAPVRFKTQPSRSGIVEDITYRNIKMKDTKLAFDFNMEWRMVPPVAPPAKIPPVVRNIKIYNVSGTVESVGIIRGLKDSPIENVVFENCTITAQKGLTLENTKNMDIQGLNIHVTEGAPIVQK